MQKWHKVEVGISRAAEGKVGKFFVGDMSDEHALQLASKVVSEGFVFGVSQPLCACDTECRSSFPDGKSLPANAAVSNVTGGSHHHCLGI